MTVPPAMPVSHLWLVEIYVHFVVDAWVVPRDAAGLGVADGATACGAATAGGGAAAGGGAGAGGAAKARQQPAGR